MLRFPNYFEYKNDNVYYDRGIFIIPGTYQGENATAWLAPQPIFELFPHYNFPSNDCQDPFFAPKFFKNYVGRDYYLLVLGSEINIGESYVKLNYFHFENGKDENALVYSFDGKEINEIKKFKWCKNFEVEHLSKFSLKRVKEFEGCITLEGEIFKEVVEDGKELTEE